MTAPIIPAPKYAATASGRFDISTATRSRRSRAIDTVGGPILSTLIRACAKEGAIAVCGLVADANLPLTVFPFILNGVQLLGIDSAECPQALRRTIWQRMATDWHLPWLDAADGLATELIHELSLEEVPAALADIYRGHGHGRQLVRL